MKRYKGESFLNNSYIKNDLELIYNVKIWICSYLNIHNLQKQTNFKNAQNLNGPNGDK